MSTKFDEVYNKIARNENQVPANYPRLDNWAIDSFQIGPWFAAMSDGGYSRWIGKRDIAGNVMWRVSEYYPNPLEYSNISKEDFETIVWDQNA